MGQLWCMLHGIQTLNSYDVGCWGLCMRAFRRERWREPGAGSPNTPPPTPLTHFSSPSPRLTSRCRRWAACRPLSLSLLTLTPVPPVHKPHPFGPLALCSPLYLCVKVSVFSYTVLSMKYILFRSHHQRTEGTFRGTIFVISFIKDLQSGAGTHQNSPLGP